MNILSWPRPYDGNPYLHRLRDALASRGVETVTHRYLAALAAAPAGARWLHLHWPEWMLRDASRAKSWARAAWFFALVDSLRARGVRLAWTAHNLIGHDEPHPDLAERFRRLWLARCSIVHGHFADAERSVRALGFEGRFVLAGHPHALDDYQPTAPRRVIRESLGYSQSNRVLLCYGAIERYKGFDRVCEAFVRARDPDLRLVIAGKASDPEALRSLEAAAAGDPRVSIRSAWLSREASADLALAADALVLGYRQFFTSGTAMLALSMGTPVLGPPRHHLAELAGEPFFSALDDPAQLEDALGQRGLLSEQTRERARAWAAQFTYASLADALAAALFAK